MSTTILRSRFAALAAAGALLTGGFVSGCQTKPAAPKPDDPDTIHHPPGRPDASKDGPPHRRKHITHPGG